jgi:hypothetical protein
LIPFDDTPGNGVETAFCVAYAALHFVLGAAVQGLVLILPETTTQRWNDYIDVLK